MCVCKYRLLTYYIRTERFDFFEYLRIAFVCRACFSFATSVALLVFKSPKVRDVEAVRKFCNVFSADVYRKIDEAGNLTGMVNISFTILSFTVSSFCHGLFGRQ